MNARQALYLLSYIYCLLWEILTYTWNEIRITGFFYILLELFDVCIETRPYMDRFSYLFPPQLTKILGPFLFFSVEIYFMMACKEFNFYGCVVWLSPNLVLQSCGADVDYF